MNHLAKKALISISILLLADPAKDAIKKYLPSFEQNEDLSTILDLVANTAKLGAVISLGTVVVQTLRFEYVAKNTWEHETRISAEKFDLAQLGAAEIERYVAFVTLTSSLISENVASYEIVDLRAGSIIEVAQTKIKEGIKFVVEVKEELEKSVRNVAIVLITSGAITGVVNAAPAEVNSVQETVDTITEDGIQLEDAPVLLEQLAASGFNMLKSGFFYAGHQFYQFMDLLDFMAEEMRQLFYQMANENGFDFDQIDIDGLDNNTELYALSFTSEQQAQIMELRIIQQNALREIYFAELN